MVLFSTSATVHWSWLKVLLNQYSWCKESSLKIERKDSTVTICKQYQCLDRKCKRWSNEKLLEIVRLIRKIQSLHLRIPFIIAIHTKYY